MISQDKKRVPIYFYYLTITKQKNSQDESIYDINQIKESFSSLLKYIYEKELTSRKKDIINSEKIIWLDSYSDLSNGNYNLIFKSAKYNHVRKEIDTETMTEHGTRKKPQDGDEEKTHLCIRFAQGQHRFLTVYESNHYGLTLKSIVDYLNEQFKLYNEDTQEKYHYVVEYEVMPGEDFLSAIKKSRTMSMLKLTVSKDDIQDDFMKFAGRTDSADEVDICLKRPKGIKKFPENLIKQYYDETQNKKGGKIKKIAVKGTNEFGDFEVDSEITKMKHFLQVNKEIITKEVDSNDFFLQAQQFIIEMRKK